MKIGEIWRPKLSTLAKVDELNKDGWYQDTYLSCYEFRIKCDKSNVKIIRLFSICNSAWEELEFVSFDILGPGKVLNSLERKSFLSRYEKIY